MIHHLAQHTTARVGGPAQKWVTADTEDAVVDALRRTDQADTPLLLLGGGSNMLVADDGFPGVVVQLNTRGIRVLDTRPDQTVLVRMQAGHNWDEAVAWSVAEGLTGLEALSGIPGAVGATPVQNVGAYGAEVAQTLHSVRAWDRATGQIVTLHNAELGFGYRDSIIKQTLADSTTEPSSATPRWVVLSVDFQLTRTGATAPVRYAQLARALNVAEGATAPLSAVREHVLTLRAGKGMVLDATDHDTWSTGSFFTNPIVPATVRAQLPDTAPAFGAGIDAATGENLVKLSAAWLIDHAGFHKGFGLADGPANGRGTDGTGLVQGRASLSTKHTLALTNRGGASTEDLLVIARAVRDGVYDTWGITLHPEPVLIGCHL